LSLFAGTGIVVKLVLLVLIYFSVVSWAIIFYKFIQVRKARLESERFLVLFWQTKRFDAVSAQVDRETNDPNVITADLGGVDNIARALRRATTSEITRLEKYLAFLATTGSTAPFIGLFGTVWGIMTSFKGIGETGSASLAVVAPGIAEALVATAIGLVAAIPAVMGFNHFQTRIKVLIAEMDNFATEFLNIVQRSFAKK